MKYAQRTTAQVNELLTAGVPEKNITVVGASKGGWITLMASSLLKREGINFVVMGACDPETVQSHIQNNFVLYGNILTIRDSVDEFSGSCQAWFDFSAGKGIARHTEIVLNIGTGHGILYQPLDEWAMPTVDWANGK